MHAKDTMDTVATLPDTPRPSAWTTLLNVLVSPAAACDDIARRRRHALLPLVLLLLSFSTLWVYYYSRVDFGWLLERMIDSSMARMKEGVSRQEVEMRMGELTAGMMCALMLFAGLASILMILAFRAVYLLVLSRLLSERQTGIATWMALSIWAAVPTALSSVIALLYILTLDVSYLMPEDVAVASVNHLFLHLPSSDRWAPLATSLDVFLGWNAVILGVGFSRWTGTAWWVGQLVGFFPFVLIYAIWAAIVAF